VIINSYNYGRFLGDAIESALAQTYPDAEVIVVDDGSTDDSREVIARYGDRVLAILKNNGGQASAMNAGFAASSGEAVIFLDADDVLLERALESVVPLFDDREVVKAHWSMPIIDATGRRTGGVDEPALRGGDFREHVRREGPLSDATLPSAATSGNAWARRFLERVMPIPEEAFSLGADTYLFGLAPAFGRIALLEEPQSLYRRHDANTFSSFTFSEELALEWRSIQMLRPLVANEYRKAGVDVDLEQWRWGAWWGRVHAAVQAIIELVPEGSAFVLADEDVWGTDPDFFGRRRVLFPDVDREYPDDGHSAVAQIEHLRTRGADAIFFAWPAHWWLDKFEVLAHHLESRYPCLRRDQLLVAFDLRG
jgi:hypothetical protein